MDFFKILESWYNIPILKNAKTTGRNNTIKVPFFKISNMSLKNKKR
jgi:hypothetical protein